jgi:hypothetical protein
MLKNDVPAGEYALMSEPLYESLEPEIRGRAERVDQELEGLGTMPLYFVEHRPTSRSSFLPRPSRVYRHGSARPRSRAAGVSPARRSRTGAAEIAAS